MLYKEKIKLAMKELASKPDTVFIGQGLMNGDRVYGTLDEVPTDKCNEMPVAENLTVGVAMGLSLLQFRPIVIFQRMDFMLCAADAIGNHMNLIPTMSNGQFPNPLIIRAIVGSQKTGFDVGVQHNKDFSEVFRGMGCNVHELRRGMDIENAYRQAYEDPEANGMILVEYKDMYEEEIGG